MSSKQFKKYQCQKDGIFYIIEEDFVGWYLILYDKKAATISSEDYLLDTLEDALFEAESRFKIPQNQW